MSLETLLEKRNSQLSWRVGSHILFWLILYLAFAYYNQISFNSLSDSPYSYLTPIYTTISVAIVFYSLVYWCFPKYIARKRWLATILSLILLSIIFASLIYIGEMLVINYCHSCREVIAENNAYYLEYLNRGFLNVLLTRLLSIGILLQLLINLMIPLAIKGGLSYHQSYVRNLQLAQDNVQLELSFLKAQLNPHFLFNTLNNLYGLIIQERTDESAQTVSKLSDFMRYTLHDSSEKQVPLEKELELIRNYIELEQLRLNQTKIEVEIENDNSVQSIPPLLFLPLLENAFKYVVDYGPRNAITIRIHVQNDQLDFLIRNTFDPEQKSSEVGGVGLNNLRKRLALHFPGSHTYEYGIQKEDQTYFAQLKLTFK